jgi:hypothetical protein
MNQNFASRIVLENWSNAGKAKLCRYDLLVFRSDLSTTCVVNVTEFKF